MYALPHYAALSKTTEFLHSSYESEVLSHHKTLRSRPRGHDGRFVPKAAGEECVEEQKRKVCGWCLTSDTSQWRVGPTDGSAEMGTLCNACGINYRRALVKSATGRLNLDSLARAMGPSRPSIQKALKRQRKQANPSLPSKRSRPGNKFSRSRGFSPLEFRALPSSPISMLLCDNSPVSVTENRDSNVYPILPQKESYPSVSPGLGLFLDEKIWDHYPMRGTYSHPASSSVLPPIQSLFRCIDQTNAGDAASFRPDSSYLQN